MTTITEQIETSLNDKLDILYKRAMRFGFSEAEELAEELNEELEPFSEWITPGTVLSFIERNHARGGFMTAYIDSLLFDAQEYIHAETVDSMPYSHEFWEYEIYHYGRRMGLQLTYSPTFCDEAEYGRSFQAAAVVEYLKSVDTLEEVSELSATAFLEQALEDSIEEDAYVNRLLYEVRNAMIRAVGEGAADIDIEVEMSLLDRSQQVTIPEIALARMKLNL